MSTSDPKAAFWSLYEGGVRLSLDGNKLKVRREGDAEKLRDDQRQLLNRHRSALARMISEEASAEMWSPALRAVAHAPGSPETYARLNEAQEAYERGDTGLARYRLYQAVRAARSREEAAA